jgi:hypothetical protein
MLLTIVSQEMHYAFSFQNNILPRYQSVSLNITFEQSMSEECKKTNLIYLL